MTKQLALIMALIGMLAACGDGDGTNPINRSESDQDSGGGDGGGDNPVDPGDTVVEIPAELAKNVSSVTYNAGDDTLSVEISALDEDPKVATYLRNATLDTPGYRAYSAQDDPLDRMFVAVTQTSDDGSVSATAISDGGQFGKFFSGTSYRRTGSYSHPTTGLVSFAGKYAGVTNEDDPNQAEILPPGGAYDPLLLPAQPRQTTGDIFLNVDFDDNAVNGAIVNKTYRNGDPMPRVTLTEGVMDSNGEFLGVAQEWLPDDGKKKGSFGGVVGTGANSLAGTLVMEETLDNGILRENGAFVLPRCGTPGSPSICDDVDDFN